MFGLFKKRRNGTATERNLPGAAVSAQIRVQRDREFAERLEQRLAEARPDSQAKIEPNFKAAPSTAEPPKTEPRGARDTPPPAAPTPAAAGASLFPAKSPPPPLREVDTKTAPVTVMAVAAPALTLVLRAAHFAAECHKAQRRKGAAREPYVNHLIEVAALLSDATDGQDSDLVMAGLLHDLIEDQSASVDDVAGQFGVGVAALVLEVTDDKNLPKAERKRLQIAHAARKSPRARMIKIADMISNLRSLRQSPPVDWDVDRQREYVQWARDVVAECRGVSPRLETAFDHGVKSLEAGSAPRDIDRQNLAR